MARDTGEGMPQTRALLLAALVVVATGAVIIAMSGDDEPAVSEQVEAVEEEVLTVTPLLPSGAIASASWHSEEQAEAEANRDEGRSTSLLEGYEFSDGNEEDRKRFESSLEEAVSDIHGLGVYVAPAGSESDTDPEPVEK